MKQYKKKYINTIRLNSFRPLCMTQIGLMAIDNYGLPPFIDGSCRREPDFESNFPSITSLCRQKQFAPILVPNDVVVYMTVKGKWFKEFDHYRLISILVVKDKKASHSQAASWYRTNNNNSIPSNCMVPDNPPYDFDKTMGNFNSAKDLKRYLERPEEIKEVIGKRRIKIWDNTYLEKSKKWGDFVITKPVYTNYHDPPIITIEDMTRIFGKVPNTRNPNKISKLELQELAKIAEVEFVTDY